MQLSDLSALSESQREMYLFVRRMYEVRELVSNFYGGPPIAYILVAGKIVATPCRLNLQPGDRVIIERNNNHETVSIDHK